MRLCIIVLWASVFLSELHAYNAAAPFELLYFYYSYKVEYMLAPSGSRTIATGCTHTRRGGTAGEAVEAAILIQGLDGICTFDEFVHYVLQETERPKFTTGGNGFTIDPDSKVTANFNFDPNGHDLVYVIDNMIPGENVNGRPEGPLAPIIDAVADKVQIARGLGTSALEQEFLSKITTYTRICAQLRLGDQYEPKLASMNKITGSDKWIGYVVFEDKVIYDFDGTRINAYTDANGKTILDTYKDFNIDATLEKGGENLTPRNKMSILKWTTRFPIETRQTRSHMNNIASAIRVNTRFSAVGDFC